jgi:hypothetical protein
MKLIALLATVKIDVIENHSTIASKEVVLICSTAIVIRVLSSSSIHRF